METLKTSPVYDPFKKSSFFWTFLSIILSLSDYGSDIAVAVLLYGEEDTGKSLSDALIFASTNPQYDDRLFIELQVQYMKIPSSERQENMLCTQIGFCFDIQVNLCKKHVLSLEFSCTELVTQ